MMESIYCNVNTEMNAGNAEEMTGVAKSVARNNPDVRRKTTNRTPQHTGSDLEKSRISRAAPVCLVLLCFLLLTAVTVLSVFIYIMHTNYTQERNQLLTNITNNTEERDELLTRITNITEERDQLQTKITNLTKERDDGRNVLSTKIDALTKARDQINQERNGLWMKLKHSDGWLYYQSSLYFISSITKNWKDSRSYCTERGADLIVINNKEEQEFVIKFSRKDPFWIGVTDSEEEGRWKGVDGTNMITGLWMSGEPNGRRGENCAPLYPLGLADYPCTNAFKWICEKKL